MKIVINRCFGGFGLSHKAVMRYAELKGITLYPYVTDYESKKFDRMVPYDPVKNKNTLVHYYTKPLENGKSENDIYWSGYDMERNDPLLVQVVEELGDEANGHCAELAIEEIPTGTMYRIDEYDGRETIETRESIDWKIAS